MGEGNVVYHIIRSEEWDKVKDEQTYSPETLKTEGFIHCSTSEQVLRVADALFRGEKDLKILCIDSDAVTAEIVYEDLYEMGKLFPHIYGSLNLDAVRKVVELELNEAGEFELPNET